MTELPPMPPPPDVHEVRGPRRFGTVLVVLLLVAAAGAGAYLLWPRPALDGEAAVEAALPNESDLPAYVEHDGLTGALSPPVGHESGRTVLTGDEVTRQCATYREEKDGWACGDLQGIGWVVLEKRSNVFFRLLSNVLAYPDEDAAEVAYDGLVADIRNSVPDDHTESAPGLGDESTRFEVYGVTVLTIRVGTVVVEASVWDGSDQVDESEERGMAEKWPALQLDKIDAALG
jgi:hypothetical protein